MDEIHVGMILHGWAKQGLPTYLDDFVHFGLLDVPIPVDIIELESKTKLLLWTSALGYADSLQIKVQ